MDVFDDILNKLNRKDSSSFLSSSGINSSILRVSDSLHESSKSDLTKILDTILQTIDNSDKQDDLQERSKDTRSFDELLSEFESTANKSKSDIACIDKSILYNDDLLIDTSEEQNILVSDQYDHNTLLNHSFLDKKSIDLSFIKRRKKNEYSHINKDSYNHVNEQELDKELNQANFSDLITLHSLERSEIIKENLENNTINNLSPKKSPQNENQKKSIGKRKSIQYKHVKKDKVSTKKHNSIKPIHKRRKKFSINSSFSIELKTKNITDKEPSLDENKKDNVNVESPKETVQRKKRLTITLKKKQQYKTFTTSELFDILSPRKCAFVSILNSPKVVKIAEATYSDVFLYNNLIYKIIPLTEYYHSEDFLKECYSANVLRNKVFIKDLKSVSDDSVHNNIVELKDYFFLTGDYNRNLLNAWDKFAENYQSYNTRPKLHGKNNNKVKFACMVMKNCGTDLESYSFRSKGDIMIFLSILIKCIALLEKHFEFEHRDLHWGNILINDTLEVSLIDMGLSRFTVNNKVIFKDLKDNSDLFNGHGDIQFDVYRNMRESNNNEWDKFHPYTNILWLRYILDKLNDYKGMGKRDYEKMKKLMIDVTSMYELYDRMKK